MSMYTVGHVGSSTKAPELFKKYYVHISITYQHCSLCQTNAYQNRQSFHCVLIGRSARGLMVKLVNIQVRQFQFYIHDLRGET